MSTAVPTRNQNSSRLVGISGRARSARHRRHSSTRRVYVRHPDRSSAHGRNGTIHPAAVARWRALSGRLAPEPRPRRSHTVHRHRRQPRTALRSARRGRPPVHRHFQPSPSGLANERRQRPEQALIDNSLTVRHRRWENVAVRQRSGNARSMHALGHEHSDLVQACGMTRLDRGAVVAAVTSASLGAGQRGGERVLGAWWHRAPSTDSSVARSSAGVVSVSGRC